MRHLMEDGRECGDEWGVCDACDAQAAKEWEWLRGEPKYAVMPPDDEFYQELRDAGRQELSR